MKKVNNFGLMEWLSYLETLHPSSIDLGLERVSIVANKLQLLPFQIPAIVVSGTNGKGSCVALLEMIFSKAGYRVGAYTSPHLFHYNERIRVLQNQIDDQTLCDVFNNIENARNEISLTYFEFGTLAALQIFKDADLDLVILEVGMGGRLDAVNIIDAEVSVITSIDLDHMEWLGNTREKIAKEKAGIMRLNKPTVCGEPNPPHTLIACAERLSVPLFCLGRDYFYQENQNDWEYWNHQNKYTSLPKPNIALQNASTVIQTLVCIEKQFPVSEEIILESLSNISVYGRQTNMMLDNIHIILDVAHNPHAISWLANTLSKNNIEGKTYAVFGMLKDKDIGASIKCIEPFIDHWFLGGIQHERGTSVENMQSIFSTLTIQNFSAFETVHEAFMNAKARSQSNDRIVVFGSFYIVAEIRACI